MPWSWPGRPPVRATSASPVPSIAQQCLNHGLLEEVRLDLVPVFLGRGIRYFDGVDNDTIRLELLQIVAGDGVTHMRYRVTYA